MGRTPKTLLTSLKVPALYGVAIVISGCTIDSTFHGRVISAEGNTPIPGAIVIASWRSTDTMRFRQHEACDRLEVIQAKPDGTFEIQSKFTPFSWREDRSSSISAYKAGMEAADVSVDSSNQVSIKMARLNGDATQKLDALLFGVRVGRRCNFVAPRATYQLEELIYKEAKPLAMQLLIETGRDEKLHSIEDIEKARHEIRGMAIGGTVSPSPPIGPGVKDIGENFSPPARAEQQTAKSAPIPVPATSAPN